MGAKLKVSLGAILAISLLIGCLLLAALAAGCASYQDESSAQMTLGSGMDKKSSRVNADETDGAWGLAEGRAAGGEMYAEAPMESFDVDAEQSYPGAPPMPMDAPTTTNTASAGGNNVISEALSSAGISEATIDGWMLPKAYAEDHGSDEQYLVRTGTVTMEVGDYEDAQTKVSAIADFYKGYVSDSQSQRYGDERIEGWVTIRVPAEKFFEAWEEVRALGDIDSENIATENVSREFLANHSQMKNLLAQQSTLQDMLKEAIEVQRKHGLGEGRSLMLDVQERLFNVTSQLQAVEDRQNALADQITKSTITARLIEVKEAGEVVSSIKDEWNWGTNRALDDSIREVKGRLKDFWTGLIWFGVTCWTWLLPLLFWIAVIIFVYRKWVRPRLVKLATEPAAPKDDGGGDEPEE